MLTTTIYKEPYIRVLRGDEKFQCTWQHTMKRSMGTPKEWASRHGALLQHLKIWLNVIVSFYFEAFTVPKGL